MPIINYVNQFLEGVLRGIEFIYKEPGVNRPLRANEDNPHDNLNNTIYRNQINKVANAIKELIDSNWNQPGQNTEMIVKESCKPISGSRKNYKYNNFSRISNCVGADNSWLPLYSKTV